MKLPDPFTLFAAVIVGLSLGTTMTILAVPHPKCSCAANVADTWAKCRAVINGVYDDEQYTPPEARDQQ